MTPSPGSSKSKVLAARVVYHILTVLAESDGYVTKQEVAARVANDLDFTEWERCEVGKSKRPRWKNAFWYTVDAVRAGFMVKAKGKWRITPEGRTMLDKEPLELLETAMDAYKEWHTSRDDNEAAGRKSEPRRDARNQLMRQGLRILDVVPDKRLPWEDLIRRIERSLPEDVTDILREHDPEWTDSFAYRSFHGASRAGWIDRNSGHWSLTKAGSEALQQWPDAGELFQKARQVSGSAPVKETLPYLGPVADLQSTPQTIYHVQSTTVGQLVGEIQHGTLALPDIQRPFVWKNAKVRDLLDSMFRGFPFGFLLTWKSPESASARTIGTRGGIMPHALVIDGQQRLTSLYAVMTGQPVVDSEFRERRIRVAFHPIRGAFAVTDAAIRRNPEWLADVSLVFTDQMGALAVVRSYLAHLEKAREITDEHRRVAEANISRLVNLRNIPVNVLQIGTTADEEQVAEIFVRINSRGQNLRQSDFILTLLAVFWEKGREELEAFARACRIPAPVGQPTPFNHKLHPGPDDLVRVAVAVGHRRARLSAAYQVLRGKDLQTGEVTSETRDANISILAKAQTQMLDINNWHEYLKILSAAGYRHKKLLQSEITALYTYALFLIGREDLGLGLADLRRVIGRWFMMATITGRYVGGSSESTMEEDLARLRTVESGALFLATLEQVMAAELTNDFWSVTLPSRLESSNTRTLASFFAAQSVMGATALYSKLTVTELLNPELQSTKEDLEIHHLFPKGWLKKQGVKNPRDYNQVANMSLLEWAANIEVGDEDPSVYAPRLQKRTEMQTADVAMMHKLHALPEDWHTMSYDSFLSERRRLMAALIRDSFDRIG